MEKRMSTAYVSTSTKDNPKPPHHFYTRGEYLPFLIINNLNMFTFSIFHVKSDNHGLFNSFFNFLVVIFVVLPMYYMEIFLGQYTKQPPLTAWKMAPISFGLFWYTGIMSFFTTSLRLVLPTFLFFIVCRSWSTDVPWQGCGHSYQNPDTCLDTANVSGKLSKKCISPFSTWSVIICPEVNGSSKLYQLNTNQYAEYLLFSNETQRDSSDDILLAIPSFLFWGIVLFLVTIRLYAVKRLVRTALVLMCCAVTLLYVLMWTSGHGGGSAVVRLFFKYDLFKNDTALKIIYDSFIPVLAASSVTLPSAWAYSARVHYNSDAGDESMIVILISYAVIFGCNMVFTGLLGTLADLIQVRPGVLRPGPLGTAIVSTIPAVISTAVVAGQFWLIFTYFSLVFGIIIHETVMLQGIVQNFTDATDLRQYRQYVVTAYCIIGVIVTCVVSAIRKLTINWVYQINVYHYYTSLSLGYALEAFVVFWIYGTHRLCDDIHFMTGKEPALFWKVCWSGQPILGFLILYINVKELVTTMEYRSIFTNILLCGLPLIIPVGGIFQIILFKRRGFSLWAVLEPTPDWGPPNRILRHQRKRFHPREEIRSQPFVTKRVNLIDTRSEFRYRSESRQY